MLVLVDIEKLFTFSMSTSRRLIWRHFQVTLSFLLVFIGILVDFVL